jgi:hypothetical protein
MPEESTALVDFACLAVGMRTIRGRRLADGKICILHPANGTWNEVEGEIVTFRPQKEWVFGQSLHLAGDITARRLDIPALALTPLRLFARGAWLPSNYFEAEDWREMRREPIWQAVAKRGACLAYEMEQVIPGDDPESIDDPITIAVEASHMGDDDTVRDT